MLPTTVVGGLNVPQVLPVRVAVSRVSVLEATPEPPASVGARVPEKVPLVLVAGSPVMLATGFVVSGVTVKLGGADKPALFRALVLWAPLAVDVLSQL